MSNEVQVMEHRDMVEAGGGERAMALSSGRQSLMPLGVNAGSVAIEIERAIAETKGKLVLAKQFPRSIMQAHEEFMYACSQDAFAQAAFYSVPNRGSGPSIRFAEELARCYGNIDYGHRELSRHVGSDQKDEYGDYVDPGHSEIEIYAWDMEKNNFSRRQITVPHLIDTKSGPKRCRDQAEIDNLIANKASKQMRGRILALCSKAMQAAGIEACKKTLAGKGDKPIAARIQDMVAAFSRYGVTVKHLENRLEHKLEDTNIDELADLRGVINALKEGGKVSEFFGADEDGVVKEETKDAGGLKTAAPDKKEPAKAAPPKEPEKPKAEPKPEAPKEEAKPPAQEKPKEAPKAPPATEAQAEAPKPAPEPAQTEDEADLF